MSRGTMLVITLAVLLPGTALAQAPTPAPEAAPDPTVAQIKELNAQARKAFDNYSFSSAGRKLHKALELAMDKKLVKAPVVGQTYLLLGITAVAGKNDLYRGLHYFVRALRIDPKAKVPKALATPQLTQMFNRARKALKIVGRPPTIKLGVLDSEKVTERKSKKRKALGLVHNAVDLARRNLPVPIKVQLGIDVHASKVFVYFRAAGKVKYQRLQMKKIKDVFRADIPPKATVGRYLHYYIEALDARGRLTTRHGSARGPNVTTIR